MRAIVKCTICAHTFDAEMPAELLAPRAFHFERIETCPHCRATTAVVIVASRSPCDQRTTLGRFTNGPDG